MFRFFRTLSFLVLVPLVGFSNLGDPVFAQESDEKALLAQKIMDLHRQEGFLEKAYQAAIRHVPAEQREGMEEVWSKLDKDAIYGRWTKNLEEMYTIDEMEAYLDYASSDLGRSALRKRADLLAAMQDDLASEIAAAMTDE